MQSPRIRPLVAVLLATAAHACGGGTPFGPTTQPATRPLTVLSPVVGPFRITLTAQQLRLPDRTWEFVQHRLGLHLPGLGIAGSTDLDAWDINLNNLSSNNADAGRRIYATAAGQVVLYGSVQPPGGPRGGVLIAHPNAAAPVWYSGYQHMVLDSIEVTLGQRVTSDTLIGLIGSTGAGSAHLHFVVYVGENRQGGLTSFDAAIAERPRPEGNDRRGGDTSPSSAK